MPEEAGRLARSTPGSANASAFWPAPRRRRPSPTVARTNRRVVEYGVYVAFWRTFAPSSTLIVRTCPATLDLSSTFCARLNLTWFRTRRHEAHHASRSLLARGRGALLSRRSDGRRAPSPPNQPPRMRGPGNRTTTLHDASENEGVRGPWCSKEHDDVFGDGAVFERDDASSESGHFDCVCDDDDCHAFGV